ncbi:MAG: ATP-binding protein [Moorea sp. SIO3C2]|nr:ATP-binding protein [Moorena sp. SIO3C2]
MILIGTNASGKSNLIDALEFLKRIVFGKEIRSALAGDAAWEQVKVAEHLYYVPLAQA